MKKRLHVYFSGRVQGVGFRITAENVAAKLGVTGWVENLDDGGVEIVAEAREEVLRDFLKSLQENFSRQIKEAKINWLESTGEFSDFGVRF